MMDASQPQCADLHSLAEALAVDFVRGGTSVSSQTPRLMKQAFPDAPALSLALLARHQLVTLDLAEGGGAIGASESDQATAATACIAANTACCPPSSGDDYQLLSVPVHAAHTSAHAIGALSLVAPDARLHYERLCLLAELVTEAFLRLQEWDCRSEDSDNEELEVDLGEEWDPGCEHLFDLHSFYDGLSSLRTPSTASPCQSASWYDAALAGGPMHEWLRSAEVAGRDADPRGAAPRGGSSSRQSRARPDMQRTSSRFSCDDVFVQVSA